MDNISRMQKPSSGDMRSAVEPSAKERYYGVSTQTILMTDSWKKNSTVGKDNLMILVERRPVPSSLMDTCRTHDFLSGNLHRHIPNGNYHRSCMTERTFQSSNTSITRTVHHQRQTPPTSDERNSPLYKHKILSYEMAYLSWHPKSSGQERQGLTIGRQALLVVQNLQGNR